MIWRRLWQYQSETLAQRKRVRRPPRDRALRVQALEIADQQQPEVAAGRQPRTAVVRIESLAEAFNAQRKVAEECLRHLVIHREAAGFRRNQILYELFPIPPRLRV